MNGIGININDKWVVFYPGTKIKFLGKSTLFIARPEASSRVYTFNVPAEGNESIFNFTSQLPNRERVFTHKCQLFLGGVFWTNGIVEITGFNDIDYKIRVTVDRGYYAEFASKSLRDFKYENPTRYRYKLTDRPYTIFKINDPMGPVEGTYYYITVSFTIADDRYSTISKTFRFYLDDYFSDFYVGWIEEICNYFNAEFKKWGYWAVYEGGAFSQKFRVYSLFANDPPEINIEWYDNPDPDVDEFTVIYNSTGNASQSAPALDLMHNSTTETDLDYIYVPVYTPQLYSSEFLDAHPSTHLKYTYLNPYEPKIVGNAFYPGRFFLFLLAPFAFVKNVLYMAHAEESISIVDDNFFDEELSKLFLFNDQPTNNGERAFDEGEEAQLGAAFLYKNILPDISMAKLINDLRYMFATVFEYDSRNKVLRIIPINKIIESPDFVDLTSKVIYGYNYDQKPLLYSLDFTFPQTEDYVGEKLPDISTYKLQAQVSDFASLPTPHNQDIYELRYVEKENAFYRWNKYGHLWEFFSEELYGYKSPGSNTDCTTGASPLFDLKDFWDINTAFGSTMIDVKWLLPSTKQRGNVLIDDDFEPSDRYMLYRGIQKAKIKHPGSAGLYVDGEYPMASTHNYDAHGTKVGDYSLAWNSKDGLFVKWWKLFLKYVSNTGPVKFKLKLELADILKMDLLKKIRIENQLYLIDEYEVDLGDEIGETQITCYPLKEKYE